MRPVVHVELLLVEDVCFMQSEELYRIEYFSAALTNKALHDSILPKLAQLDVSQCCATRMLSVLHDKCCGLFSFV